MKLDATKIIGILLCALLGCAAWYLQRVDVKIDQLTEKVHQMAIAIEIDRGGDPRTVP